MGLSWWWFSGQASACQCRRCGFDLWSGKIPWRRKWPGYSLEGLFLKLKLQYFVHLKRRADFLKKTLMVGKTEGKRRSGWQRIRWLDSITDSMDMNWNKVWETVEDRGAWCAGVHGVAKSWTRLRDWTTAYIILYSNYTLIKKKTKNKIKPRNLTIWKIKACYQVFRVPFPQWRY